MAEILDRWRRSGDLLAATEDAVVLLLGRLLLAAIFLPSGFNKLTHLAAFAHSLAARGVPAPDLLAVIGAASEFVGPILIALGLFTRWAALLMVLFTAIASLIAHDFWNATEAARHLQYTQFMKNLAIIGGFLILIAAGPGRLSLDRRLR